MKIDSHQHFWKFNTTDYAWIDETMRILRRDYLPDELETTLKEEGFDGCISVQARQSLQETKWLLQLADQYSWIKGIVGWVDLCSPGIENELESIARNKKLVGIRHVLHDETDDYFMLKPEFKNGLRCLEKFGLTYDLLLFPKHLKIAASLLEEFPDQPFVIDHISKPLIRQGFMEPWSTNIRHIASYPNVYCKLSGMVTEADPNNWCQETFNSYLDVVFEAFGPDRLMIGSDWPVCLLGGNYNRVTSIVRNYISNLDPESINKIMGENCKTFYKLT